MFGANKIARSNIIAANAVAESNVELGKYILKANREYGEKLEEISKAEIKSKDRVDITLEEYEFMKNQIKTLECEVNRLRCILEKIEAPLDMDIIPDSITTYWREDINSFDKQVFMVEFAVDRFEMKRKYGKDYFRFR